jgi:3-oxoacyl-[acyl-carrier protein] reductase
VSRDLAGKVAVVTGGARGIGKAIALALARNGAHIMLHYNASSDLAAETCREIAACGVRVEPIQADLRHETSAQVIVSAAVDAFGTLDILVNNAGVFSSKAALDISVENWRRMHAINLLSPFLLCQEAARAMQERPGGVILNIASGGGISPHPAYEVGVHYATAKAGLVMLTKRLAHELAPDIRVNCIAPGMIDSKSTPLPASRRQDVMPHIPLSRIGTVDDVAQAAVFLCSDQSSYMTGQIVNVDGGILMP